MAAASARESRALVRGARDGRLRRADAPLVRRSRDRATRRDGGRRPVARRAARQGRRASRRHGCAADPEENDVPYASTRPGRDARLRPRRSHGDAARRRADPRRTARRARRARCGSSSSTPRSCRRAARAVSSRPASSTVPISSPACTSSRRSRPGVLSSRAGAVLAAADLFTLEIVGRGGHGANPHETVDPVAVAAQVITNLQQIVARETDPFDSVVVSVTTLDAGTARNIIPGSVRVGGTVRTLSTARRQRGARRDGACHRAASRPRIVRPTGSTSRSATTPSSTTARRRQSCARRSSPSSARRHSSSSRP